MSRLYKDYLKLKEENNEKCYIFKSGIFFILLDEDAKYFNEVFSFKLTNLNANVVKCGFPVKSKDKYFKLMKSLNIDYELIDYSIANISIINTIKQLDIDNISKEEALDILKSIYHRAHNE